MRNLQQIAAFLIEMNWKTRLDSAYTIVVADCSDFSACVSVCVC